MFSTHVTVKNTQKTYKLFLAIDMIGDIYIANNLYMLHFICVIWGFIRWKYGVGQLAGHNQLLYAEGFNIGHQVPLGLVHSLWR